MTSAAIAGSFLLLASAIAAAAAASSLAKHPRRSLAPAANAAFGRHAGGDGICGKGFVRIALLQSQSLTREAELH